MTYEDAEEHIIEIWRSVMGDPSIGGDDSFLELGGTSIAAYRIMSRLKQRYGDAISLRTLFDNPTPRALAGIVAGDKSG